MDDNSKSYELFDLNDPKFYIKKTELLTRLNERKHELSASLKVREHKQKIKKQAIESGLEVAIIDLPLVMSGLIIGYSLFDGSFFDGKNIPYDMLAFFGASEATIGLTRAVENSYNFGRYLTKEFASDLRGNKNGKTN